MDWMAPIGESWLTTLLWLVGLAVAFGTLGLLMPCNRGMYWWKDPRAAGTDFLYWFVVPLFLRVGRTAMLIAAVVLLCGGRAPGFAALKGLPLWQQGLAILLIQDVLLYALHRAFHSRLAWKFHAVHHSPRVLDWMSTQRTHPVNYLLEFAVADVAVLLLGFSPEALLLLGPFNIAYSAMVHANLNWTFGPLRYVLASPVFHRWHHTMREEGLDKNFASTFPFLDLLLGTFYLPSGRLPEDFGTGEADFPEYFWGQFLHPFRSRKRPACGLGEEPASGPLAATGAWARAAAIFAVVSLVGGGMYFTARPARQGRPPAPEAAASVAPAPADAPREAVLAGHTGAVLTVAVSADGRRVVSGSEDGTVKVWDAATGREVHTLRGHARPVGGVALAADGRRIVSGGHDRTVRVWDAATGRPERTLTGHTGPVYAVAVSADSRCIVSAGWAAAKVWDAATGRELRTLPTGPGSLLGVAVSGHGRRVAAASWEAVKVWDADTGREERTLTGHAGLVRCVALSPDGLRIASGGADRTVKVWDVTTGRELLTLTGHAGPVHAVAFSPDGTSLLSGSEDGTVKVWDAATGRERTTFTGHADGVTSVAVSGDGRWIVAGGRDGTVRVWDARGGAAPAAGGLARRD